MKSRNSTRRGRRAAMIFSLATSSAANMWWCHAACNRGYCRSRRGHWSTSDALAPKLQSSVLVGANKHDAPGQGDLWVTGDRSHVEHNESASWSRQRLRLSIVVSPLSGGSGTSQGCFIVMASADLLSSRVAWSL
jgi:hypothetical protein